MLISYLTLVPLLITAGSILSDASDELASLCQDKTIELRSILQLRSLAEELKSQPEVGCDAKVKAAIVDALPVIEDEDACSKNKIDQISQYHANHLSKQSKIPKSLRQFMVAYGLKASSLCKSDLADLLFETSIDLEEFHQILGCSAKRIDVAFKQLLGLSIGYDHPILVGLLESNSRNVSGNSAIPVGPRLGPHIKRIKDICLKFKPHYDELIVPVSRLIGLGFNYKSEKFEQLNKEKQKKLSQWSKIIFICESLKATRVVDNSSTNGQEAKPNEKAKLKKRISMIEDTVVDNSEPGLKRAIEGINLRPNKKYLNINIKRLLKSWIKLERKYNTRAGLASEVEVKQETGGSSLRTKRSTTINGPGRNDRMKQSMRKSYAKFKKGIKDTGLIIYAMLYWFVWIPARLIVMIIGMLLAAIVLSVIYMLIMFPLKLIQWG